MAYPYAKQCPICNKYFIIEQFSQSKRKYCYECSPEGRAEDYTPLFHAMKRRLIEIKGGKCEKCGYNKCEDALHFHHIDPSKKDFSLSEKSNYLIWEKFLEESNKCQLLCANCHAEIHYQALAKKEKISDNRVFDEISQELLDNATIINKKYCIDCGKEISSKAIRCEKCNSIYQRTTNRPTREELKKLIRTLPFTQIGEQYKVSDNAIRKWCDLEKLPRTKSEINSYSDEDWENI